MSSRRSALGYLIALAGGTLLRVNGGAPLLAAWTPNRSRHMSFPTVKPFRVHATDAELSDLKNRLDRTRWADAIPGTGWDYGTDVVFLRQLVDYWRKDFDWRRHEATVNSRAQFTADIDGATLHFVHEPGRGSSPLPIVLLHGWPGSFHQMSKLVPLLTEGSGGGASRETFDVVVPSLPGFGFSSIPGRPGMSITQMAPLIDTLMTKVLGYARYAVAGGDIGAGVALQLAGQYPGHVIGVQTNGGNPYLVSIPSDLTDAERAFVDKSQRWMQGESAYAALQSSKPQTVGFALADSPVGLASWMIEKYRAWSDSNGDVLRRFSRDELLTFVMLYWLSGTAASSMRVYYENAHDPSVYAPPPIKAPGPPPPMAQAVWPGDIAVPPREWTERTGKLARYTAMPRGGHFPEWEEPELVAAELREVFRPLR